MVCLTTSWMVRVLARLVQQSKPSPNVRLQVASWPDDAPRGAVAAFCREHGVSPSWFHKVRSQARASGPFAVLAPQSRRPRSSPHAIGDDMVALVLTTRERLRVDGHDFGPLSVESTLVRAGVQPPSRATIARIFTRAGVVVPEPGKKPRSAMRRFVYPAPNCLWQIDATEWSLANGRTVAVFQLIDDHSRLALASHVATGETAAGAIEVVQAAIVKHGVPQRFLSDNGRAFNSTRMGSTSRLVRYLEALGVEPITGKRARPTTQGKNERFHRTLHAYLNAREPAATIAELQTLVNAFDEHYNTKRAHQSLGRNTTPLEAWNATAPAPPPQPGDDAQASNWTGVERKVDRTGTIRLDGARYLIGREHAGTRVLVVTRTSTITVFNDEGTQIAERARADPGTLYVGSVHVDRET
jgi:putative transposase